MRGVGGPQELPIEVVRGRRWVMEFERLDEDGAPVTIVGATIVAQARNVPGGALLWAFTVTTIVAANGTFRIEASATDTAVSDTEGVWELTIADSGSTAQSYAIGPVMIRPGVVA